MANNAQRQNHFFDARNNEIAQRIFSGVWQTVARWPDDGNSRIMTD
jgi:hypothetical protein